MILTPDDFETVASVCAHHAGIRVDTAKTHFMESRLGPVARREGYESLADLVSALRDPRDTRLVGEVVEAIGSCEVGFFRDARALDRLVSEVLPDLVRARGGLPVRLWVASCGAGQEVYSLAIRIGEDPALMGKVELFGSDLSDRCLRKAMAGVYTQYEVQNGLSARRLVANFEERDGNFVVAQRLRQSVRWRRVNLMDDVARLGPFDLIICRQLLARLTQQGQSQVLSNLSSALAPGGRLVVGRGEAARAPGLETVMPPRGIFRPRDGQASIAA
jgi:chemotaxis protein methyltransferase CheR